MSGFEPIAGENVQLTCTVDHKTATTIDQICDRYQLKRPVLVAQMVKYAIQNYSPRDPAGVGERQQDPDGDTFALATESMTEHDNVAEPERAQAVA